MGPARRRVLQWSCLALTATTAACSGDPGDGVRYDRPTVERFLADEVMRTSPDLPVEGVACPDQLPRGVGAEAHCDLTLGGVPVTYVVQLLAGRRLEARPRHPIVDLRRVTEQISEKAGSRTAVTCGSRPVAQLAPGQEVVCTITASNQQRRAVVTADPDGTIRVNDG